MFLMYSFEISNTQFEGSGDGQNQEGQKEEKESDEMVTKSQLSNKKSISSNF